MRGGTTIHPEDIRRVIAAMPGVREVEVLGVPDAIFEQALVACVVAETGVTAAGIRAYCAAELSVERRPDRAELFDTLPLGPAGKVRRDALAATIAERRAAAAAPADPTDPTASILTLAAETFQVSLSDLTLESGQDTVDGWDSFNRWSGRGGGAISFLEPSSIWPKEQFIDPVHIYPSQNQSYRAWLSAAILAALGD